MRKCIFIILVILISIKIANGQKSEAYEVINGVYMDFIFPWYQGAEVDHYYLVRSSCDFPNNHFYTYLSNTKWLMDSLSEYIPKEEFLRMLSDTSFIGTNWKQKFLIKARVVSEKKANELMGERGSKEYNQKMEILEKKAETKPIHKSRSYYQNKYSNQCFRFSYPVFNSSREYALVYLKDTGIWLDCVYLCHMVNGKFDKIIFQLCDQFVI
jgi:hypothetical protein